MAERSAVQLKGSPPPGPAPSLVSRAIRAPFNIFFSLLSRSFEIIRPYTPRLIPLLVCAFFLPLVIFISLGAGWFVWSSLSVSWEVPLYLQYGDGVPPYAYVQLPKLMTQQKYTVSVDLQLPATEANLALGNFMTSLTLSTFGNKTIAQIRRPAIATPPTSSLIFGKPSTIQVKVPLLADFVTSTSSVTANVEIGRRDGWTTIGNGHGREVSIASASLRGLAVPHGIRGLAIRFPLLSSLAASSIFFGVLSLILGLCMLPLVVGEAEELSVVPQEEVKQKPEKKRRDSSASQASLDEGGRRRRRSRSKRLSGSSGSPVKVEAPETLISSAEELSSRGLRRRSSKSSVGATESEM